MAVFDIAKKFAINYGVGLALGIVRGFLNEQIENVTARDLYRAIIENRDLWTVTPENTKIAGRKHKQSFNKLFMKYQDLVNTELILEWMMEDHPELYSTIINTNSGDTKLGLIWFDKQVRRIKREIIEM